MSKKYVDYVWLDSRKNLRTKQRVIYLNGLDNREFNILCVPEWNYDGSSTGQASIEGNTEIILKPVYISNPENQNIIAMCDIFDNNGTPLSHRKKAEEYFSREEVLKEDPWFGLEQEFFLFPKKEYNNRTINFNEISGKNEYCGTNRNYTERTIIGNFVEFCNIFGVTLSGINSEVSPHQWEFQLFGKGLNVCDQLYVARFILETIVEQHDYVVLYSPKIHESLSGSGCHVNFSTFSTRSKDTGYSVIEQYVKRFEEKHLDLIGCCSEKNKERLSGKFETAKWDTFTWGIGTRNTSIRVPNDTFKNKCGYLEDRRPGADIDPYLYCTNMCKIALRHY